MVQAAPEPEDVYWENLAASEWSQRLWKTINTLAAVLVVLVSLAVLTAVSTVKIILQLNEEYQGLVFLLSVVGAGISVGTNVVLERMCTVMSHLEKPSTRTDYERSVCSKLAPNPNPNPNPDPSPNPSPNPNPNPNPTPTPTPNPTQVFSKLAPAFVINTAIAPLVVGCVEAGRSGVFNGAGANGNAQVLANVVASVFGNSATGARPDQKLTLTPNPHPSP